MSINSQIQQLERIVEFLSDNEKVKNRITIVAAKEVEAEYKTRIFVRGKDSKGGGIGKYDTRPFYAGKDQLKGLPKSKFKPLGKDGKSTFKSGKKKKTRYLKDGYAEFRNRAGRQNKKVDLNLTGTSEQTIQIAEDGDSIVLGFTNKKREEILRGNEKRFGKDIFSLSRKERELFASTAQREAAEVMRELIRKQ